MGHKKKSDTFANPFKSLKGFSVSSAPPEPLRPATPAPPPAAAEEIDFAAEMKGLGVREIAHENEMRPARPVMTTPAVAAPAPEAVTDAELFTQALGRMETVFSDTWSDADPPAAVKAESRRLKQIRQGKLKPQATLDLHGLTRDAARSRIGHFFANSLHHDRQILLIVTGWGKSGGGEAVLRDDLLRGLRDEWAPLVVEWDIAPRQLGGDGAVVVVLKRRIAEDRRQEG